MSRRGPWALLGLLLCRCSYQFGADTQEVPLHGDPPSQSSFVKLNDRPAQNAAFVRGADNAYWIAIEEFQPPGATVTDTVLTVKRLSPPEKVEHVQAHHIQVLYWAFYLVQPAADPAQPTMLTIHPAGSRGPDETYQFPPGEELLRPGAGGADLYYWVLDEKTTTFDVLHRGPLFRRQLSVPRFLPGVEPKNPLDKGELFFAPTGDLLFTRDGNGETWAHSTVAEADNDLGVRPPHPILDSRRRALITCGDDGLRSVPYDAPADRSRDLVLDPDPCSAQGIQFDGQQVLYLSAGGQTRKVPADGSTPHQVVMMDPARRILYQTGQGQVLYSLDPQDRYIYGAGDGWLLDWRFMDRGLLGYVPFSSDGTRLRWVEHAANNLGVGDLLSASVPRGTPLMLARNVPWYQFEELYKDGRVLAVANYSFPGPHNRIIVIDEQAREARWVADGASAYAHVPGSTDLLIEMPVDAGGVNLMRVPVPPPQGR